MLIVFSRPILFDNKRRLLSTLTQRQSNSTGTDQFRFKVAECFTFLGRS